MSLLQQLQSLLQVEGYTHNIYRLCTVENRWTHTDVQQKEFHSLTAVNNNMNLSVRVQSGHRLGFNVRFSPSSCVITVSSGNDLGQHCCIILVRCWKGLQT